MKRQAQGSNNAGSTGRVLQNPRWVNSLFSSTEWSWLWLMVRLWLGVRWLEAGWHKISQEAWTGGGLAVKGFWERVVAVPEQGRPPIAYDWYREFLDFLLRNELYDLFGILIAYGEVLVGIALILGAFTGIAAFFGAVMNWNFMLAGTASTNPILGIVAIGVIVAWKTAGWWGVDRILLPYVGAPWLRGRLLGGQPLDVSKGDRKPVGRHVEAWIRMLVASGMAIFALSTLDGALQMVIFFLAVLLSAVTVSGLFMVWRD